MYILIGEKNGQKIEIPLTADAGAGNPVGSYLYLEKKSNPQGYLYCDGSTFDETVYPALYQYLGTNVLPDWREFSAVGAEQNTTNVYDAQTNPNGVIHDHDVYTQGEAKDDQVQEHTHSFSFQVQTGAGGSQNPSAGSNTGYSIFSSSTVENNGRKGNVTRGKRKAVFIYIKATSGLTENQQENVLNTINENNSYSTEEHPTGKKWIDGKDIYQKDIPILAQITHDEWSLAGYQNISALFGNAETITQVWINGNGFTMTAIASITQGLFTRGVNITTGYITLEYTKTN